MEKNNSSGAGLIITCVVLFLFIAIYESLTADETTMVIIDIISCIIILVAIFGRGENVNFSWRLALVCIICLMEIIADCAKWYWTSRILAIFVGIAAIPLLFGAISKR